MRKNCLLCTVIQPPCCNVNAGLEPPMTIHWSQCCIAQERVHIMWNYQPPYSSCHLTLPLTEPTCKTNSVNWKNRATNDGTVDSSGRSNTVTVLCSLIPRLTLHPIHIWSGALKLNVLAHDNAWTANQIVGWVIMLYTYQDSSFYTRVLSLNA